MNIECEHMHESCGQKFKEIEERLHQGDNKFVELGFKIDNLVSSQKTLTKALWGLVSAIFAALISFVLGKI